MSKNREKAVERYMVAVELAVNGKQPWRTALENSGAWRNYPFLSPDSFPNVASYRSAVYDLIGTWNRIKLNQDRPEYVEFRRVLTSELSEVATQPRALTDEELVKECLLRNIKADDKGNFYKEHEVVKVEREYIKPF